MDKPTKSISIDTRFKEVEDACEEFVEFLDSLELTHDEINNYENDIVEKAMKVVFGDKVYDWINSKI